MTSETIIYHPDASELDIGLYFEAISVHRFEGLTEIIEPLLPEFNDHDAVDCLNKAINNLKGE